MTTASPEDHEQRPADTQRLREELDRLELRARMLLVEHRHVVASIREMQSRIEAADLSLRR